jgi:chromosome segregation ATPase
MEREFSQEEIAQIVRAARVFAPAFSEEQFRQLAGSQRRLADSGFVEASWGLVRLQKEKGMSLSQALDAYKRLLKETAELEEELARAQAKLQTLMDHIRRAEESYRQVEEAKRQATQDLRSVERRREQEEKELAAFRKKAEKEQERIEQEIEECRREASVTKEEVVAAGRLKAVLAERGMSLEFTLDLCQEFVGHENATEELATGLEEHRSLTGSNAALAEEEKRRKSELLHTQARADKVVRDRTEMEATLSRLNAEISDNQEILDFYHRYLGLRPFMEYIGGWNGVTCHHCAWCGALFLVAPGRTRFTGAFRCPWCHMGAVEYDRQAYATIGLPAGTPLKLLP